jgi:hypothetical protein
MAERPAMPGPSCLKKAVDASGRDLAAFCSMELKILNSMRKKSYAGLIVGIVALLAWTAAWAMGGVDAPTGQATSPGLSVRAVAEVRSAGQGSLTPARRVVPGDEMMYTLEIRNISGALVREPVICFAIPAHARLVAGSASGPGAEVQFSVDGGRHFEAPELLKVPDGKGGTRTANTAQYTHIRWRLKQALKANSTAFARFRAVVD